MIQSCVDQAKTVAPRKRVERRIGKVPDQIWQLLDEDGFVAPVLAGEDVSDFDLLLERAKTLLGGRTYYERNPPPSVVKRLTRKRDMDAWEESISTIMARTAEQDGDVQLFRSRRLKGKTIAPSDVEAWILGADREDINRHRELTLATPFEHLYYLVGTDLRTSRINVGDKGIIRELFELSTKLVRRYDWVHADATMFVLAGTEPKIARVRVRLDLKRLWAVLSRIHLEVNILTSPEELCRQYEELRRNILGGKRIRNVGEKHARLAQFAARIDRPSLSREDMLEWNRLHPDWRYARFSNFSRDWKVAQDRVRGFTKQFRSIVDPWLDSSDERPDTDS